MKEPVQQRRIPPNHVKKVLPFEQRKTDPATWFYEHRAGVYMTVIAFLLFGIVFISTRIVMTAGYSAKITYVEVSTPEELRRPELTPEQMQRIEEEFAKAANRISDANAEQGNTANRGGGRSNDRQQDAASEKTRGVYQGVDDQKDAIAAKLSAGREMYERGMREEQAILNSRNQQQQQKGNDEPAKTVKVEGRVLVEYDLVDRKDVYMHVPAYQCEGSGKVVVSVTVNRNGNVTSASVSKASSTSEVCLTEMSVLAAKRSRFNVSQSAPTSQQGTITYIFVRQ